MSTNEKLFAIALFMGAVETNLVSYSSKQYWVPVYHLVVGGKTILFADQPTAYSPYEPDIALKYDKSWDWLMPVWKHFFKDALENDKIKINAWKEDFDAITQNFHSSINLNYLPGAFEVMFLAVQWYNNNK